MEILLLIFSAFEKINRLQNRKNQQTTHIIIIMDETSIQAILEQYSLLHDQIKEYNDETKALQKVQRATIKTRNEKIAPLNAEISKLGVLIKEYLDAKNETSIIHDGHEYNITEITKNRKPKNEELEQLFQNEINMSEEQVAEIMSVLSRKITSTAPSLNVMRKFN